MNDSNNIYINGVLDGKIIAHAKLTIIKTIYGGKSMVACHLFFPRPRIDAKANICSKGDNKNAQIPDP